MVLAQNAPGQITALDLFPKFIDQLNAHAAQLKLQNKVKGIKGSMEYLPFQEGELDLIWSEGAIYNIGFEKGLKEWNRFLKKGGYIAVTEASWFTVERPKEIQDYWDNAYPEIDTIPNKVAQLQNAGYIPVAVFILPENCWTDNYYIPQTEKEEIFLKKHKGNTAAEELIAEMRLETKMYQRHKQYYGYVFYIGKKISRE
jgi:ubiquinone/menaquinone biosynthesis C-methylase UbiE